MSASPKLIKKAQELFNDIITEMDNEQIKLTTAWLASIYTTSSSTDEDEEEEEDEKPAKGKKKSSKDEDEDEEVEDEDEDEKPKKKKKPAKDEDEDEEEEVEDEDEKPKKKKKPAKDEDEDEDEDEVTEEEDEEEDEKPKSKKKPAKDEEEDEDEEVDYSTMKLAKLKTLATERSLPVKTLLKAANPEKALIKALKAYDESAKTLAKQSVEKLIKLAAKHEVEYKMGRGRSSDEKKKGIIIEAILAAGVEV